MKEVTNAIHDGMTQTAAAMEDIMSLLRKIMENHGKKVEFMKFQSELAEDDKGTLFTLDDAIYGRTVKELAARGIPFCSYDIVGKTRKCLIVADRRTDEVAAIAGSMKLRVGLIIDSKTELDAAVWEKDVMPKEYVIESLSAPMAQKIMEFADKYNVLAIMEKQKDGTYSIYSIPENADKLNRFAYTAAWDITGKSGTREKPRLEFLMTEREQVLEALTKTEEGMQEAYIISAENPDHYIHIEPEGFDVYADKTKRASQKQAMNPEEYSEYLKLQIHALENPVYITKEEMEHFGGMDSERTKQEIDRGKFKPQIVKGDGYIIQAEKEVRNWIENKMHISSQDTLTKTMRELPYMNLEEFKKDFAAKIDHNDPKREEYYQLVISNLDNVKAHLRETAQEIEKIKTKEIIIERPIDITIEMGKRAAMDQARETRQQDREKIKDESRYPYTI